MPAVKNILRKFRKSHLQIAGALFLILLAIFLLWYGNINSNQALAALVAEVYFEGEYRIEDGEWQPIVEGEHIPSTKGDVTLRGNFHMLAPDGEYVGIFRGDLSIAFYTNHISLTFYEKGIEPYTVDAENPLYGKSACGKTWNAHTFMSDPDETIEILIHNPHSYGNETAIDELISGIAFWAGMNLSCRTLRF